MARVLICIALSYLQFSCSIKTFAIRQLGPILADASPKLQHEKNWEFFKNATPGSLQLVEILLESDPGNRELLAVLTKGFAAYGYIVNDTEYLLDKLAEEDESQAKKRAIFNLSKGLHYGLSYLQDKGIDLPGMFAAARQEQSTSYFDEHLDPDEILDLETAFFTGTSWLLLANLRKDNIELVGQISTAFELINWVCHHDPHFQSGLCTTMTAVFHLARPKALGGKPELALKLLQTAMKRHPQNLLIPVTYLEWYVVPFAKDKEYRELKKSLQQQFAVFNESYFVPGTERDGQNNLLNLFNAMAEKRFLTLVKFEDELF